MSIMKSADNFILIHLLVIVVYWNFIEIVVPLYFRNSKYGL